VVQVAVAAAVAGHRVAGQLPEDNLQHASLDLKRSFLKGVKGLKLYKD